MTLPVEFTGRMADLVTHRIHGMTRMGHKPIDVPIVSQIDGNLWTGGCPEPRLGDYFQYVLNLYPWQGYALPSTTEIRRQRLYDEGNVPNVDLLEDLAGWVNERRPKGPILVHCQAGINRSALVAGLALIRSGMKPADAIALLREKRSPSVLSNSAFEAWLLAQETA